MKKNKKIITIAVLLVTLVLTSTIGYKILLDLSLVDALYMTVITISTVGYGEVALMDTEAKLFSIIIIFISLGTVGYLFTSIVSSFLEGDLRDAWRRRKMEANIESLKNHYIICGAGETGSNAIKQFKKTSVPFIVIDTNEEKTKQLIEEGIYAIHGDGTQEEVLERARIQYAKGLISAFGKDSENVYTVLTAREMNEDLYIVSRAIDTGSDDKLKRAGANNTISPNEIGGSRMASLMLRPTVISFLDIITHAGEVVLDLEDVVIHKGSDLADKSLKEARIPQKTGLIVLAIKKSGSEKLTFNPSSDVNLGIGDAMVVLGQEDNVKTLRKMAMDVSDRHLKI